MHEREVKGLLVRRSDDDLSWPEGALDGNLFCLFWQAEYLDL
jgi:hypothetical protein